MTSDEIRRMPQSDSLREILSQAESLVKDQIRLAQLEASAERGRAKAASQAYIGAASATTGATISAVFALGFFLKEVVQVPTWVGFALLAGICIGVRFALTRFARNQLKQMGRVFSSAAGSIKEDLVWIVDTLKRPGTFVDV